MMTKTLTHWMFAAALAAVAAGCASKPSRFYTLNSTARAGDLPAMTQPVAVGPVTVPSTVDRPQFTVQVGPNRVVIAEFDRWAAPLSQSIAVVIAGDLATLLDSPDVATVPFVNFDPAYRVSVSFRRFESLRDEQGKNEGVLLDAVWLISPKTGGKVMNGHTRTREQAQGDGFDALAAAHSRALATISRDIAAALRAEAAASSHSP